MENQDPTNQQSNETPIQTNNMAGGQILNVADPSRETDGVNKRYVDSNTGGKFLGQVNKTDSFSTSSNTFVDVTDLTITADVASGKRVLLMFSGPIANDTLGAYSSITFSVDGANVGNTDGMFFDRQDVAGYWESCSISFVTNTLTSGSHTFKVQAKVGSGGLTLNGATNLIFIAIQL